MKPQVMALVCDLEGGRGATGGLAFVSSSAAAAATLAFAWETISLQLYRSC